MAEYPINKGVGRQVEFKGLRAQYLFLFAGGLLAVFILVVVLYMGGVDQVACLVHKRRTAPESRPNSVRGAGFPQEPVETTAEFLRYN